jgi:hypothetical protein
MVGCASSMSPEDVARIKASIEIEKALDKQFKIDNSKVKLLLWGAGKSGKLTIFKQMRVLLGPPLSKGGKQKWRCHDFSKEKRVTLKSKRNNAAIERIYIPEPSKKDGTKLVPPKLIIAGAPTSGMDTPCKLIKQKYGIVHLSTGDMLRAAVAAGTNVEKTGN